MPSMKAYLKSHEDFIKDELGKIDSYEDLKALKEFHLTRIGFMQHERLIHLLVTIACLFFMFLVLYGSILLGILKAGIVVFLILILLTFYIIHYYLLENGVQRWYLLADEIDFRLKMKEEEK